MQIRREMESKLPVVEKMTRPENYGGHGYKTILIVILGVVAFLGLTDVVNVDNAAARTVFSGFKAVWLTVGGIAGGIAIVRIFKH